MPKCRYQHGEYLQVSQKGIGKQRASSRVRRALFHVQNVWLRRLPPDLANNVEANVRDVERMRHIVKRHALVLSTHLEQEALHTLLAYLELVKEVKVLEHAVPAVDQRAAVVVEVRHVVVHDVRVGLLLAVALFCWPLVWVG